MKHYFIVPLISSFMLVTAFASAQTADEQAIRKAEKVLAAPYAKCKVTKPLRPSLSSKDRCLISKLSARCSKADDCLVQCVANGLNGAIGGSCWHLCFDYKFDLPSWTEPKGIGTCWDLR